VASGVRVYSDTLFRNFIEKSDGESWVYSLGDLSHTAVPDFPGLQTHAAVTGNPLTTYALAVYYDATWYFSGGQFYRDDAPGGAYEPPNFEHTTLINLIDQGKSLGWYENQRPYVSAPWTQPIFTNSYVASAGSRIRASSEQTSYGNSAYKAMDGSTTGGAGNFWAINDSVTGWWRVDFPYKIALTKLTHYNRGNGDQYAGITGCYYTEETRATPIGDSFSLDGSWATAVIYDSAENPIMTRGIYFQKTGGQAWSGIGEVVLEATSMTYEAGEGR
jgi:hypothetical protein